MMQFLEALAEALYLIFSLDPEVWGIMILSLRVSGTATFLAACVGIPLGMFLGLRVYIGRRLINNLVNTAMGLPPVVIGLYIFLMLSRSGPLGFLSLLYTPTAMIIAQWVLATPIVTGITMAAVRSVHHPSAPDASCRLTRVGIRRRCDSGRGLRSYPRQSEAKDAPDAGFAFNTHVAI